MRVFAYEWTCCIDNAPLSLRREGWAMLWAVLEDFISTRELEVVTLVHEHFPHDPPGEVRRIRNAEEEESLFRDLAGSADATLVIAPETGNVLVERARWAEEAGGRLLGPNSQVLIVASDKVHCDQCWHQHSVPTPTTRQLSDAVTFPAVLKPRDGAGSQATFLVRDAEELAHSLKQAACEGSTFEMIAQDYVAGQPASVAWLLGPRVSLPLPAASQELSQDGRFHYLGGTLPLPSPLAARAVRLSRRAVDAIPGLRGYVGIDLVLGDAADGSADFAIEINPRLTTSYLGLRMLAQDNLARAMLRVALGQEIGKLRWSEEVIRFNADGRLEI